MWLHFPGGELREELTRTGITDPPQVRVTLSRPLKACVYSDCTGDPLEAVELQRGHGLLGSCACIHACVRGFGFSKQGFFV